MTVKKIGTITLTFPLWWLDFNNAPSVTAEVQSTINGGVIVYEQAIATNAKNITLSSKESGWQTIAVKDAIKALAAASLGTTTTITTTDDEVIAVRFRHENGAVKFERVYDTKLFEYYTAEINLARI